MKLTLGVRLFLSVLAAIFLVAAAALELAHWRWFGRTPRVRPDESVALHALTDALTVQYRARGDWSFVPGDAAAATTWLRAAAARAAGDAATTLPFRVGLVDADGRTLAGAVPQRLTIMFASIDTQARAISVDGRVVGRLIVATPQDADDALVVAFLVDQQGNLARMALVGVLASALVAALLAAHFRRPVRQLVAGTRQLEQARFDTRLSATRSDEFGELARAFNRLAQRLAELEAARRRWVADTSHELRTPLSVLRAQIEALQDGVRAPTPETLASLARQVSALGRLVDDLYELARADVGALQFEFASCDAWALLTETVAAYAARFAQANLSVTVAAAPPLRRVRADAGRLRQLYANLLENSARYTAAGGTIAVHGSVAGAALQLVVDDSAPGVPDAQLARLGERFFRGDESRSRHTGGSGLGLALARQIALAHGGALDFAASPLGGLRAIVTLPLEAAP